MRKYYTLKTTVSYIVREVHEDIVEASTEDEAKSIAMTKYRSPDRLVGEPSIVKLEKV